MQDDIKAFRDSQLFSKEDVLKSIALMMDYYKNNSDLNNSKAAIQKNIELCMRFKEKLKKCKIPTLCELWWCYKYEFTGDGIDLQLCTESDVEIDEEGFISSSESKIEHVLFSIKCEYLTVSEYAKMQDVSDITVRQWIRRGKLRHAKKTGRDWIIPVLEDKPPRGFETVQYLFSEVKPHIDEFPFISLCDSIMIFQDSNNKSIFNCHFNGFRNSFCEKIILSRKEVEKLEHDLIASGKAKVESNIQFVPNIRS